MAGPAEMWHSQILGSLKEFGFYPESIRKPSKSCKQGSNVQLTIKVTSVWRLDRKKVRPKAGDQHR